MLHGKREWMPFNAESGPFSAGLMDFADGDMQRRVTGPKGKSGGTPRHFLRHAQQVISNLHLPHS